MGLPTVRVSQDLGGKERGRAGFLLVILPEVDVLVLLIDAASVFAVSLLVISAISAACRLTKSEYLLGRTTVRIGWCMATLYTVYGLELVGGFAMLVLGILISSGILAFVEGDFRRMRSIFGRTDKLKAKLEISL